MFLVTYTDMLTVKSHNLISKYTVLKFVQNILKKIQYYIYYKYMIYDGKPFFTE